MKRLTPDMMFFAVMSGTVVFGFWLLIFSFFGECS